MSRYKKSQGVTKIATSWIDRHKRKKVQLAQKKINEAQQRKPGDWRSSLDQSSVSGLTNSRLLSTKLHRISDIKHLANKLLHQAECNRLHDYTEKVAKALLLWKRFSTKFKKALGLVKRDISRGSPTADPISLVNRVFQTFGDRRFVFPSFKSVVPFNMCCVPNSTSLSPINKYATVLYQVPGCRFFPHFLRHLMESAVSPVRYTNTMIQSNDGITIKLDVSGYIRENITVEVEGGWLVVEALATVSETGGGYVQRHMMRRYELPSFVDVTNIKVDLNEQSKELRISVPTIKPKVRTF